MYPFLATPKLNPFVYFSSRICREIVFLLIGPIVGLLAMLSIPMFGWQNRGKAFSYLWSCLRLPGQFLLKALLFASFYFLWICILVAIVPFFITLMDLLRDHGVANMYISIMIFGLGLVSFWYAQRTIPAKLVETLSNTPWPLEIRTRCYDWVGFWHHHPQLYCDRHYLRSRGLDFSSELSGDRTGREVAAT